MSGNWTRADAYRLVEMFGRQQAKTPNGHRDMTALVTFIAYEAGWDAAQTLAIALDVDELRQEQIYKRIFERNTQ